MTGQAAAFLSYVFREGLILCFNYVLVEFRNTSQPPGATVIPARPPRCRCRQQTFPFLFALPHVIIRTVIFISLHRHFLLSGPIGRTLVPWYPIR